MLPLSQLLSRFDTARGTIEGCPLSERRLSDLRGVFVDEEAYEAALRREDALVYTVSTFDFPQGGGALHCGLGVLLPGRVGDEYYLTRGHLHTRREASEIYVGLRGKGLLLMEADGGGAGVTVELSGDSLVYVPGHTAHRTVNTGDEPLVYLGIYPSDAGHDYDATRGFRSVVVHRDGHTEVLPRQSFIERLHRER